jgi:hypothetical protein
VNGDFLQLKTSLKGAIGERIVDELMRRRGWRFQAWDKESGGSHTHDRTVFDPADRRLFGVEVKTYPRRAFRFDTGVNKEHYFEYCRLDDSGLDVLILWADEEIGTVYGNFISQLRREHRNPRLRDRGISYPRVEPSVTGEKVYFSMHLMKKYGELTAAEIQEIRALNSAAPQYRRTP